MKRLSVAVFILFIVMTGLFTWSCKDETRTVTPLKIEFKKHGELHLFRFNTDSVLASFNIEIADDEYETQTGLMNRHSLDEDQAMLFIFPNVQPRTFYMKNTYIPLDIIYLNANKQIVSFQNNAKPLDETSLPSQFPAKYVLEINAGLSTKYDLRVGDRIEIIEE